MNSICLLISLCFTLLCTGATLSKDSDNVINGQSQHAYDNSIKMERLNHLSRTQQFDFHPFFLNDSRSISGVALLPSGWRGNGATNIFFTGGGKPNYTHSYEFTGPQNMYIGGVRSMKYSYSQSVEQSYGAWGLNVGEEFRKPVDINTLLQQDLQQVLQAKGYRLLEEIEWELPIEGQRQMNGFNFSIDVRMFKMEGNGQVGNLIVGVNYMSPINSDFIIWEYTYNISSAMPSDYHAISQIQKLSVISFRESPSFQFCMQQLTQAATNNIRNIGNAIRSANNQLAQAYQDRHNSFSNNFNDNSHSERFSDAMLDVVTIIDPFTQREVKVPASNDYYYTNGIGDYLGTNSPLLNDDMAFSTYNWVELQRKYN